MKPIIVSAIAALTLGACQTAPSPPAAPEPPVASAPVADPSVWQQTRGGPRHAKTGVLCPLTLAGLRFDGELEVPGVPAGDDVLCGWSNDDIGTLTLYLTRFEDAVTPEGHLGRAVQGISKMRSPVGEVGVPRAGDDGPITPYAAAFELPPAPELEGETYHTAVWIEVIGEWHIKVRSSYPTQNAPDIARAIDQIYSSARLSVPAGTT
ncbi:MAG: hypothetical protein AAFW65_02275 [Pseudomonadota bacterium]